MALDRQFVIERDRFKGTVSLRFLPGSCSLHILQARRVCVTTDAMEIKVFHIYVFNAAFKYFNNYNM